MKYRCLGIRCKKMKNIGLLSSLICFFIMSASSTALARQGDSFDQFATVSFIMGRIILQLGATGSAGLIVAQLSNLNSNSAVPETAQQTATAMLALGVASLVIMDIPILLMTLNERSEGLKFPEEAIRLLIVPSLWSMIQTISFSAGIVYPLQKSNETAARHSLSVNLSYAAMGASAVQLLSYLALLPTVLLKTYRARPVEGMVIEIRSAPQGNVLESSYIQPSS